MADLSVFLQRYNIEKTDLFQVVLGQQNNILPGGTFMGYPAYVGEAQLICYNAKEDKEYAIPYAHFQKAEFGIGSGNLWLQCTVNGNFFVFCSPRKCWKSPQGKKLIEKIEAVTPVEDKKAYDQVTGKLFFIYMFK